MGYPHSVPGNEDRRLQQTQPGPDHVATPEPVITRGSRRGPDSAVVVALTVLVAIGTLIVKPWAFAGELTGSDTPSGSTPTDSAPVLRPLEEPGDAPTSSPPLWALIENLEPIDPARWSRISTTLRRVDHDGVIFVARWPGGLYWSYVPVEPAVGGPPEVPSAPAQRGSAEADRPDTVRMTGYLAAPVAIGFTRRSEASPPTALAWLIRGPGAELRVPLRHPVGDIDQYLWLGPGLGLPRGEQRNRREISRWPPMWLPGVYRFDLGVDGVTRHIFVVLEPDGTG